MNAPIKPNQAVTGKQGFTPFQSQPCDFVDTDAVGKECIDINLLVALSEGKLPDGEKTKVFAHLRECQDCMELLMSGMDVYGELPPEVLNAAAPVWKS